MFHFYSICFTFFCMFHYDSFTEFHSSWHLLNMALKQLRILTWYQGLPAAAELSLNHKTQFLWESRNPMTTSLSRNWYVFLCENFTLFASHRCQHAKSALFKDLQSQSGLSARGVVLNHLAVKAVVNMHSRVFPILITPATQREGHKLHCLKHPRPTLNIVIGFQKDSWWLS